MKISLLFKHTTTVLPAPAQLGSSAPPAAVNVIYTVLDFSRNEPLTCKGGRYVGEYADSYEPGDDEAAIIYELQRLVENRYLIRIRPVPNSSGDVTFEAVKILSYERPIGEIEWERPSRAFEESKNVALELGK